MPKIFISYRRDDNIAATGRLFDRLSARFGTGAVFMDVDGIPAGVDFRVHLSEAVSGCDCLLAVVGEKWLWAELQGKRRLDDPGDFVRVEIESALARGITVIPVLFGATRMPRAEELPGDLAKLAYLNAVRIELGQDFHPHVDRLIRSLERVPPPRKPDPTPNVAAAPTKPRLPLVVRLALPFVALAAALLLVIGLALRGGPTESPSPGKSPAKEVRGAIQSGNAWTISPGVDGFDLAFGSVAEYFQRLAFSPQGHLLAYTGRGVVQVHNAPKGELVRSFKIDDNLELISLAFSPDGKQLVAGTYDPNSDLKSYPRLFLWDIEKGTVVKEQSVPTGRMVAPVAFTSEGRTVVFGIHECETPQGKSFQVRSWTPPERDLKILYQGDPQEGLRSLFVDAGKPESLRVVFSRPNQLMCWDAGPKTAGVNSGKEKDDGKSAERTGQTRSLWKDAYSSAQRVAFRRDGQQIAAVVGYTAVKIWDANSGSELQSFNDPLAEVNCSVDQLAFSPEGAWLVTGSSELFFRPEYPRLKIWDLNSKKPVFYTTPPPRQTSQEKSAKKPRRVSDVAFSPDGKVLAALVNDPWPIVRLWDVKSLALGQAALPPLPGLNVK